MAWRMHENMLFHARKARLKIKILLRRDRNPGLVEAAANRFGTQRVRAQVELIPASYYLMAIGKTQPSDKMLIVRPIGEDLVPDLRILRLHAKSSLARNPVLQLLFEVCKEPPGRGNCLLTTLMARLGKHSFLLFFHIPVGGCQDPSICTAALGRFIVTRFKRR